jgi:aminoglycoside 6'-N-acetyltransferase
VASAPASGLSFEPLRVRDFPLLSRWLAEPLVARWWDHDPDLTAVHREFGPSVEGDDVAEYFFARLDGRRFGLIQRYPIAAYPEYVEELTPICALPEAVMSIDYLIGEPHVRGRGHGAAMIRAFVDLTWIDHPEADDIVVPVHVDNVASWRALASAGFSCIARGELEPDNPAHSRDHVVYAVHRPGASGRSDDGAVGERDHRPGPSGP